MTGSATASVGTAGTGGPLSGRVVLLTAARTTVGRAVAAGLAAAGARVRGVDPHPVSGLADAVADCRLHDRGPHLLVHVVEMPAGRTGPPSDDPDAASADEPDPTDDDDPGAASDRALATARRVGRQVAVAASGGGGLVFVAVPPAGPGPDAVTEAGLTGLARALATEFGPAGVRVNQVAGPGCADRPDQVSAAVLFLASDRAAGVTGQTLRLGGTP
ncbi:hypothetical protein O7623_08520 [Solwaraspora sp. WMMD791]|uniref:Rossmann fold domain-containing protein n=1 Tax=Solwaraspora sp. WMMD791 TaxID=3016086 RepID=UPI00249B9AD7|nr:hypothetical protein [Solwaraspora sp. WMMD791]WFE29215.1 hypothetical protein O7623_08520 [Solwaraspora sp. WMMD791]